VNTGISVGAPALGRAAVNVHFKARRRPSFLKKEAKNFYTFGFGLSGRSKAELAKVFWFFFSKKNVFLS
jgi:hypothetical protein